MKIASFINGAEASADDSQHRRYIDSDVMKADDDQQHGTELAYGVQAAYVTPILAGLGIPLRYLTLAWAISPILGLLTQPVIGSWSDSCTCPWGRRRPFMVAMAIGILIGLLATAFGKDLGLLVSSNSLSFAIAFTLIGNGILDYSLDSSGVPCRAYLFDVTPQNQEHKFQRLAAIFASVGAIAGYLICGIEWNFAFGQVIFDQAHSVFILTAVLVCLFYIVSLFSVKEVPFIQTQQHRLDAATGSKEIQLQDTSQHAQSQHSNDIVINEDQTGREIQANPSRSHIKAVFYAVTKMPREFAILCLLDSIAWIGYVCFSVFYTDFVGIEVFKGNPTAPLNSTDYLLYQRGVKIGSWGLLGQSAFGGAFALCLERICRVTGSRLIMIGGFSLVGLLLFIMAFVKVLPFVIAAGTLTGIVFAIIYSIPFGLVGQYHAAFKDDPRWSTRGFGIDSAILNSCMYAGQLTVSFCVGAIVEASGTRDAAAMTMGGCLLTCAFLSIFVVEPQTKPSQVELNDFTANENRNNDCTTVGVV
ncbi:Membrane-associated transporter protein [Trichoplax sp. H2]|nr:Membrane-associated transporter protein [Trichoplax sp. H2]|eukprot:RDD45688.1 Membrane-associated transporter protein [Trichoplax sp. H2]